MSALLVFAPMAAITVLLVVAEVRADRRNDADAERWSAMLATGDRLPTAPEDALDRDHTSEALRQAYIDQSARTQGGKVADFVP